MLRKMAPPAPGGGWRAIVAALMAVLGLGTTVFGALPLGATFRLAADGALLRKVNRDGFEAVTGGATYRFPAAAAVFA